MEKKIGDNRTFQRYLGTWTIKDIIRNKNIEFELVLKPMQCPYCGGKFGDKQKYVFNYIEILECDDKQLHLGIADEGRYIILEDYIPIQEIKMKVKI